MKLLVVLTAIGFAIACVWLMVEDEIVAGYWAALFACFALLAATIIDHTND